MDMKALRTYGEIITGFLSEYVEVDNQNLSHTQYHLIVNESKTEFVLIALGWQKKRYFNQIVFHLQLVEDEIWIHQNNTDVPIERHLIEQGISRERFRVSYLEPVENLESCRPTQEVQKMAA
ncbi:MAG: element excision factor XisI family protein [Bacteroidota bacterium]